MRGHALSETKNKKMKNEKNFNKIWPGIGEAVCTIPQACREVFSKFLFLEN